MTLIEEMAKAHWADSETTAWEKLGREDRECMIDVMRGALLALAEAELPENVIRKGALPYLDEKIVTEEASSQCFRAMLREIAGQK